MKRKLKITIVLILILIITIIYFCVNNISPKLEFNLSINNLNYLFSIDGKPTTLVKASNNTQNYNIMIYSLNSTKTQYELTYDVCEDILCKNILDDNKNILIEYSSNSTDPISGIINANETKDISVYITNNDSKEYFVKFNLNVAKENDELILSNKIPDEYINDVLIATYIKDEYGETEIGTSFPTTKNYLTYLNCYQKDGKSTTASGSVVWDDEKWLFNVANINTSEVRCNVMFEYIKPPLPNFTYLVDGVDVSDDPTKVVLIEDSIYNVRVKFLVSGTLTFDDEALIDVFLVGGGGGGKKKTGGGGGDGGYTDTIRSVIVPKGSYEIVVGDGGTSGNRGGSSSAFGYTVNGGGTRSDGGSGGGGSGTIHDGGPGPSGGSNGSNGAGNGGTGQGRTTCEFGEISGGVCLITDNGHNGLYSGGGGGFGTYGAWDQYQGNYTAYKAGAGGAGGGGKGTGSGVANTGGGGGYDGGSGGSGIVIIRNSLGRIVTDDSVDINDYLTVSYTGTYELRYELGANWYIKLFTSGTLTFNDNVGSEVLLVGGGGGGAGSSSSGVGGGGGNGGVLTQITPTIVKDTPYDIVIGAGGASDTAGEATTAFGATAEGGSPGGRGANAVAGSIGNGKGGLGVYFTYSEDQYGFVILNVKRYPTVGEDGLDPFEIGTKYGAGGGGGGSLAASSYYTNKVEGAKGGVSGGGNGGYNSSLGTSGVRPTDGDVNTGSGGGGSGTSSGGAGGSGIVIVRNAR